MNKYGLGFISDIDLYNHVKTTVLKYRFSINLNDFNNNIIDPIKLTFDSKVYTQEINKVIESEVMRQIDKSNTNHIGYFHQNIFKYLGKDRDVPQKGYDIINQGGNIYAEMKNKHNTMNSSSSQKTYMQMMDTVMNNPRAICYLVEVIAKNSQDIEWSISLNGKRISNPNIRRISIDKFYSLVTKDHLAFSKLCAILPIVLDDVIRNIGTKINQNTVFSELKELSPNILKSLYIVSFQKYEGFNNFNFIDQ